jgi:UDP-N-acetylglucosamine diphosphorylase / glucose-1-phosphate thymidylyltransferase / UDP-N-acetylgalactosamine diphosphorylase / glucosamine-1-phosphate N-acetyltransferase / galactosamine-1-phosphate N-acetyltransferase
MKLAIQEFIDGFSQVFPLQKDHMPWQITRELATTLPQIITYLGDDFQIENGVAIHRSATIESGVVLKGPIVIQANCFVGAHAYLRGGVYLAPRVSIGPGCELKSSIIMDNSAAAHFNFIGDSIVGRNVNFEAGSILANHYNERADKHIHVALGKDIIETHCEKFGSLIGDSCRIGANAVLSPGTILPPGSIVKRLELVEQVR